MIVKDISMLEESPSICPVQLRFEFFSTLARILQSLWKQRICANEHQMYETREIDRTHSIA